MSMIIKSKFTKQDFINANFIVFYSKPVIKIFTVFVSLALIATIIAFIGAAKISLSQIIIPVVALGILPLLIYSRSSRGFTSNNLNGAIEYNFDQEAFNIKGESFNVQLNWNNIYKVTKTKNWLLIWQNKNIATPILKRDIQDVEINELKEILAKNKVKNNL